MDSPTPTTVWSVLNSAFALWFLSSVVIAGLTTVYTLYQKNRTEKTDQAGHRRRLNIEIGNRIAGGLIALRLDRQRIAGGSVYYAGAIYGEALSYLNNRVMDGANRLDFSIYPEYRWQSFRPLLFDLSAFVAPSELPDLRNADATYAKLEDLADRACIAESGSTQPPNASQTLSAVEDAILILQQLQMHPSWKTQL
jgi:hypothetical protein